MKVAVIGGGWAGLAAAVDLTQHGQAVTLFEMAATLGGRARSVNIAGTSFDNGQHILIGAYSETLDLMQSVGIDVSDALFRSPLNLVYPDGSGLRLQAGNPTFAFAKAVIGYSAWSWRERFALLLEAGRWAAGRFCCDPALSVAELTRRLPGAVKRDFIDPLCVASLNTRSPSASAFVFLRVLQDALFSGKGSADLLLPRVGLSALFPDAAQRWLADAKADVRLSTRVETLTPVEPLTGAGWRVNGESFNQVIVASSAVEAARLVRPIAARWADRAASLQYEPIVTVYIDASKLRWPAPIVALHDDTSNPAQFAFDLGRLGGREGLVALVVSGASTWVSKGLPATAEAAVAQLRREFGLAASAELSVVQTLAEKRATFVCSPGLDRPPPFILPGLTAAGDYVDGPYPATLEGAVRSGLWAARQVDQRQR